MGRIEAAKALASIRDDHRAGYVWPTKTAAEAVKLVPNKFGTWWTQNREKLLMLSIVLPVETMTEIAVLMAEAAKERERRGL